MATKTDITIPKGSDVVVRVTITGTGTIAGQNFLGTLRGPTAVVNGTATISDAVNRIVDWTLADTDTDDLPIGPGYAWDVWRTDDGSEYPVAYGAALLQLLPRFAR